MATYTSNLNLYNPAENEIGWKSYWDTNFTTLDTSIGTYLNADGSFKAATAAAIPFSHASFTATDVKAAIVEALGNSAIVWGDITGTLSNQIDLQAALDLKYNAASFNTDWDTRLAAKDTDDIIEGSSNLYDQVVALTAGTGIGITGTYPSFTISNTQTSAIWGSITGTLSNQTDLQNALNSKQDNLSAGNGISITSGDSILVVESEFADSSIPFTDSGFTATNVHDAIVEGKPGAIVSSTHTGVGSLTAYDNVVFADATSGGFTLTLPSVATATNMLIIKKTDATMNVVTIDGYNSETIDGQTTYLLDSQYMYVSIVPNGTSWLIIANN